MLDTILSIIIIVGFPLLIVLLHKLKIIDASSGAVMIDIIKDSFKEDYKAVKKDGFIALLKNRWHLHGLVGVGTTFTMLLMSSVYDMVYWQQLILIPLVSLIIQGFREFALALYGDYIKKPRPADLSDARFGMYGSIIAILLYGLLSLFFVFNSWVLTGISLIIYSYVAYLVFKKKQ